MNWRIRKKNFSVRCILEKKKIAYINEVTQYASDMNVLLSYHNLLDDWQDEKNYPKHVMSMMLKKDYARISHKYPRQAEAVEAT